MRNKRAKLPPHAAVERGAYTRHGRYGVVGTRSHTPYARFDALVANCGVAAAAAAAAAVAAAVLGSILTNCGCERMHVTRPPDAKSNTDN